MTNPSHPSSTNCSNVIPPQPLKVRDEAFQAYESANFGADSAMTTELTEIARGYLTRKVKDPELRAKLTPAYPVGCKRPLQSRAWFPTFSLPNVAPGDVTDRRVHRTRAADSRRC